jgi:hypothetical protein
MVSIKRFGDFLILENSEGEVTLNRKLDEIELIVKKMFKSEDEFEESKSGEGSNVIDGVFLESIDRSKSAKTYKELKVFLFDDEFRYDLIFRINLEKVIVPKGQTFNPEDLKTCDIEFKRYYEGEQPLGVVEKKEFEIDKIESDLFEELISEIEEKYPSDRGEDEFSIETE